MLNHFLIVDVEATGPKPCSAQVLTGHFLLCDKDLDVIDQYELTSRPRSWDKEAEDASAIHGITHAQAMRFTPYEVAMRELSNWLDSIPPSYFVAHANRSIFGSFSTYDYAVLTTNLFDLNYHWALYRACPRKYILSTHSIAKYLNLPCSYDLKSLSQYLGLGSFNHHDAKADTLIAYEILKRLLPEVDLRSFLDHENFKLKEEVLNDERSSSASIPGSSKRTTKKPRKLQRNYSGLI